MEGRPSRNGSVIEPTDISPELARSPNLRQDLGREGEAGTASARSPASRPPSPSSPLLAHLPHVGQSCCPGFVRKAMESMEWAMAPSPERGLSCCSSGPPEERKVAAETKAVAIPLCPTKRSGRGQPGPCGQPLGAVPEAEEALLFPYGSHPSPAEFPFPSS